MAKIASISDGNLNSRPITVSTPVLNRDIDCTFTLKPSGDLYSKTEAAAVAQSVKNLIMTNKGEKPFQPNYGADMGNLLFELGVDLDNEDVTNMITSAINTYEPRAKVREIKSQFSPDYNTLNITIVFLVTASKQVVTLNVNIARTR